ncbi:hypothetical protein LCGC14_2167630, partial [marine sediment metagenome]
KEEIEAIGEVKDVTEAKKALKDLEDGKIELKGIEFPDQKEISPSDTMKITNTSEELEPKKRRGRKKLLKNLTEDEFLEIKRTGMMFELYPNAPDLYKDIKKEEK